MAAYRLNATSDDMARIDRLVEDTGIDSRACLFRVIMERILCRHPNPSVIPVAVIKRWAKASEVLTEEPTRDRKPLSLRLGRRYEDYLPGIMESLGFEHQSTFLRTAVVMFEREEI